LAQLNRGAEERGKKERPRLSHLRESGAIEQDADVVMFIHREEVGMSHEDAVAKNLVGNADLIVAKQRNGATDDIELLFQKEWTRFVSVTREYDEKKTSHKPVHNFNGHAEEGDDF
jgi:replicative DNA helicase